MICRVFGLGQGAGTGMHIYLDPETKRQNGELEFSAETWIVKPLSHSVVGANSGSSEAGEAQTAAVNGASSQQSTGQRAERSVSQGPTSSPSQPRPASRATFSGASGSRNVPRTDASSSDDQQSNASGSASSRPLLSAALFTQGSSLFGPSSTPPAS